MVLDSAPRAPLILQFRYILHRYQYRGRYPIFPLQAQHGNLLPAYAVLPKPILILKKRLVLCQVLLDGADREFIPYIIIFLNDGLAMKVS